MLRNKTAVITGASRGIGRAIAIKMAKNGANIAVLYGGSQEAAEKQKRKVWESKRFVINAMLRMMNSQKKFVSRS